MASQTQGIQQLLAAEKRAAEKVSEARKRKPLVPAMGVTSHECDLWVGFRQSQEVEAG